MDIAIDKFVHVKGFFIQHSRSVHFPSVFLDQSQVIQGARVTWMPCSVRGNASCKQRLVSEFGNSGEEHEQA